MRTYVAVQLPGPQARSRDGCDRVEIDIDLRVAKKIGAAFNPGGEWGFKLDESVPMQTISGGLKAMGFSLFSGAHPGLNYQGKINGSCQN